MVVAKEEFTKVSKVLQELLELTRCDSAAVALRDALHWVLHQLCAYYNATKKTCDVSVLREDELRGFVWSVSNSGVKNGVQPDVLVAVNRGDVGRLRQLLKKDPNSVDHTDGDGRTGLMHCCRYTSPSQMKCAQVLLHKSANIDHQDCDGRSALHAAVSANNMNMVDLLIQNHAKLSLADQYGCAPVHFASQVSSECLKILIDAGIDRNCQNNLGLTPSMWACHADKVDNLTLLLAEYEDAGDVKDSNGRGLIHWAAVCQGYSMHCLRLLLDETSVRLQDSQGRTALHFAAMKGHELSCQLIGSSHPESLNLLDKDGCSALHLAAMYGHANVVNCLLQLGADPAIRDGCSETALDYTRRLGLQYCHWLLTSLSHCLQASQPMSTLISNQPSGSEINAVPSTLIGHQPSEGEINAVPEPRPPSPAARTPQSPRFRSHVGSGHSGRGNLDDRKLSPHSAGVRLPSSNQNRDSIGKTQPRPSSSVYGDGIIITAAHSSGSDSAQDDDCSPTQMPAENVISPDKLGLLSHQRIQSGEGTVSSSETQPGQAVGKCTPQPLEGNIRNLQVIRRGKGDAALESSILPMQRTSDMMKHHSQQMGPGIDGYLQVSCGHGVGLSSPSKASSGWYAGLRRKPLLNSHQQTSDVSGLQYKLHQSPNGPY